MSIKMKRGYFSDYIDERSKSSIDDKYLEDFILRFKDAFLASDFNGLTPAYSLNQFSHFPRNLGYEMDEYLMDSVPETWSDYLLLYYQLNLDFSLSPTSELCTNTKENAFFQEDENNLPKLMNSGMQFYLKCIGIKDMDPECEDRFLQLFKEYYAYLVYHTKRIGDADSLKNSLGHVIRAIKEHDFKKQYPLTGWDY